ncbi:MAG TPA: hypothetical protein VMV86_03100, partial [Methanosarcinales archaeon]|nr:hypothetical protein [Methanosarcinales archaeon]
YFGTMQWMRGNVNGKDPYPYLMPKKFQVVFADPEDEGKYAYNLDEMNCYEVDITNPEVISLLHCSKQQQQACMKRLVGISDKCKVRIDILEAMNWEAVSIIEEVRHSDSGEYNYCTRMGYVASHGLKTNETYDMFGYIVMDPKTQQVVHIILEAKPVKDSIDSFAMTDELMDALKIFQPKDAESVGDKFLDIADCLSNGVTKIYNRPNIHIGFDLIVHSLLSFKFNNDLIHKGWVDALLIGDTRCGKNCICEGLQRHYGVGDTISAENTSIAGLIGGLNQLNNQRFMLNWGAVVRCDRSMLLVDEAQNMPVQDFDKLSRIRSEGVAEITKIVTEQAKARVRLLIISNTRSGKPLSAYTYGVEAIEEFAGRQEEISRFDFAMTVATDEVDPTVINSLRNKPYRNPYKQELLNALILWAWSRTEDQSTFTQECTEYILAQAIAFGSKYSPAIALVQAENFRLKLARLSAAAAARLFSTEDGEIVLVKKEHAEFVVEFLHETYSAKSMRYDQYSANQTNTMQLKHADSIERELKEYCGRNLLDTVNGMLSQNQITVKDLADFMGDDRFNANGLVSMLRKKNALNKENTYLTKSPAFIEFLQKLKQRLEDEL